MQSTPRQIEICQTENGRELFTEWLDTLDKKMVAAVIKRIDRIEENGHFGEFYPVGEGVYELVFDTGPGYRVYFGMLGSEVHLISGGQKRNQQRDIDAARRFWGEHA